MSIQLQGTGLVIKGKTIVNENGDLFGNNLSVNTINIRTGGLHVNEDSVIKGSLNVGGIICGDVHDSGVTNVRNKYYRRIVKLLHQRSSTSFVSFTGVFISSDGWVLTCTDFLKDGESKLNKSNVWGTIDGFVKEVEEVKCDERLGICVIKFADLKDREYSAIGDGGNGGNGGNISLTTYTFSNRFNEIVCTCCNPLHVRYANTNVNYVLFCGNTSTTSTTGTPNRSDVILDYDGNVCSVVSIITSTNEFGGVSSMFIKKCVDRLIYGGDGGGSTLLSIDGILKYSDVSDVKIVMSGLLEKVAVSGVIIEDSSKLRKGCIITHIDDVVIKDCYHLNELINLKKSNDVVKVTYISPPSIESNIINLELRCLDHCNLFNQLSLSYVPFEQECYTDDYQSNNATNVKLLYEKTHQAEIKQQKRMYLQDRLKGLKNRKKSRVKFGR